jgi:hypothetical protein
MLSKVERPSAICFGDTSLAIRTSEDFALPMHCDDGGSHMKKPFVALLLLMGAAAMLATSAFAQDDPNGIKLVNAKMAKELLSSRAHRLGTSAGPDPDTVYVGKSFSNHVAADNYWNLYTGDYLPGTTRTTNAFWDWDNSVGIQAADSLQGWWPIREQYNATGGLTLTDDQRPWWALDHGNSGNYVISQQSSAKRTYGVVSYWHADPGSNAGSAMMWSPISGTKSAWCGLRQHGDNSVVDQVTKNPFNQDVVQYLHRGNVGGNGSPQRFPGYVDQADQMMYRDIAMTPSQTLTVSFNYRTRMSTSIATAAATRTGWFHGDPLAVTSGNFISSSAAGAAAPQDSFMVYVGAPVNDAACVYSDGVTRPVYDKQRRWFSEVVKVFGSGNNYFEIFKAAGNNPADTLDATPSSGPILVPAATISSVLGGVAGNVRLVFRCKTNRFFADSDNRSNGYNSAGRGAVLLDDVTVSVNGGASPAGYGTFEGAEQSGVNAIDNRNPLPPGLVATDVWRTTGKPISPYIHVEALSNLTYNDLCGPPSSPARICNIGGVVLTVGNHDDGENAGDSRFTALREVMQSMISPTINLLDGPGGAVNSQGMRQSIARATDDVYIWYDMYAGMFNLSFSGEAWTIGNQAYPAKMPNGGSCWGQPVFPGFIIFNPEPQCFTDFEPMAQNGIPILTSNATGIPDSLRLFINHQQQCFRFAISLGCNSNEGGYFDNVSVAFVDLPGVPGQASAGSAVSLGTVSTDIWQLFNDTFPANETAGLPGTAAFDTTSGLVRTGLNNAQATGNALRFDVPGDSTSVLAANATVGTADDPALKNVRVDLVFRILPGPGNYRIAGGRSMAPGGNAVSGTLLQTPTNQAAAAVAGDASFWGQYMADPGLVSRGTHTGPGGWDPLTWNSCRLDTLEVNIFPVGGAVPTGTALTPGRYQTTIHESDPKFATLGSNRFKCFVVDTTKAATSTAALNNVVCDGTVPAWLSTVPQSRTGWDGSATTKEFSPIIPDGLLTPGAHVQYFYRKSHAADPNLNFSMMPDTNVITPQNREGPSTDQHRWQQFAVLPDRWKNNAFGGAGSACMLYIDLNDRRGNEGRFVATMDSVAATATAKHGAHNGWYAAGTTDITSAGGFDARTDGTGTVVANKNSQPGTTWDMYQVKASESLTTSAGAPGSRLANRSSMGFATGKEARSGPTPEMLRAYYVVVAVLSGDLNSGVLGPFVNRSQNDIALLSDYLTAAAGRPQPRGLFIQGDGFGQSEQATGAAIDPQHITFMTDKLGVVFRNGAYQSLAGNLNDCADVLTTTALTASADVYGVQNLCTFSNDVYNRNPALSESQEGAFYENVGLNGPYVSDVVKTAVPLRNWVAVTSGYEIEHMYSRYCETDNGRLAYYYYMLNKVFGGICQITGAPGQTLDTPQSGRAYTNFMKIGNSVMRQGTSVVRFSVAKAGRVQVSIFDVTGRKVRNLADRVFPAGESKLEWDGTDDAGSKVARGVYFVRSSVQKDAGRIIVLNN